MSDIAGKLAIQPIEKGEGGGIWIDGARRVAEKASCLLSETKQKVTQTILSGNSSRDILIDSILVSSGCDANFIESQKTTTPSI